MNAPGAMDPVLAFLEFADRYRRTWRCWLLGGPRAVDALQVRASGRGAGASIRAETESVGRGRGSVKVSCGPGERAAGPAAIGCEAPAHRCAHETRRYDLLPPGAERRSVARLFAGAWERAGEHVALEGETVEELLPRVACACGGVIPRPGQGRDAPMGARPVAGGDGPGARIASRDPAPSEGDTGHQDELLRRAMRVCGLIERRAARHEHPRLLIQRLEARLAQAVSVDVRLGGLAGRFWAAGTPVKYQGALLDLEGTALGGILRRWLGPVLVGVLTAALRGLGFGWPGQILAIDACVLLIFASLSERDRPAVSAEDCRRFVRHLRAGWCEPPALMGVVGPDAASSSLLHALFAHLASAAQLALPGQGGTVLDDAHVDLASRLMGAAPAPSASSIYRLRLGREVSGPERADVLCIAPPGPAPDALVCRTLRRAAHVWVVLPAGGCGPEADRCVAETLAAACEGAGEVMLVVDGPADPACEPLVPDAFPETGRALERLAIRSRRVNLEGMRRRYLAGEIGAAECAGWVRWLLGEAEAPPDPANEAGTLSEALRQISVEEADSREIPAEHRQMAA